MNYYEHHIGDYAEATQHLSILEDGVYSRLLRKYYATEKPLPVDVAAVQRLVVARSKEEKAAVEVVLQEFFDLREDGWHQARCDDEIARYLAGEPEREAKKANKENRLQRHRQERAELFAKLTDAGLHAEWNIPIKDLRARVAALSSGVSGTSCRRDVETSPETPETPETFQVRDAETASATPATATQTPDTRHQFPDTSPQSPTIHLNTPQPPKGVRRNHKPVQEPEGFVRFWAEWPAGKRKEARGKCAEAWVKGGLEGIADQIVQHVIAKRDRTDWAHDGGQFVEAPAAYLNQRRWEGATVGAATPTSGASTEWWAAAGFQSRWEAENERCFPGNAHTFRDGKKLASQAEVHA